MAVARTVESRVLEELRSEGIALVPFDELFADAGLWRELSEDIGRFARATEEQLAEPKRAQKGKSFIARRFLIEKEAPQFTLDDPWLRLAVSDRLLQIVGDYRSEPVHLIDFDNWYTIPDPAAETRVKSQRWHRDPWDEHITKVFIYFSDVGEDAGPFEYVRQSAPGGRYGELWPWEAEGVYPPDDEFDAAFSDSDRLSATGPAGTIIFCDTSGFHRGGWARLRPRILSVQTYVGSACTKRPRFTLAPGSDRHGLTEAARAALRDLL